MSYEDYFFIKSNLLLVWCGLHLTVLLVGTLLEVPEYLGCLLLGTFELGDIGLFPTAKPIINTLGT